MNFNKGKILGYLFMTTLVAGFVFMAVSVDEEVTPKITSVGLHGNEHLSTDDYFAYTRLNDKEKYKFLTVNIIKDRFEKHPYVDVASVKLDPDNKVYVDIVEKNFDAIITQFGKNYFLTDDYELLPFVFGTKNVDYPIIRGLTRKDTLQPFTVLYSDPEIKTSLKIMAATELINKELYSNMSEIYCSGKHGIELHFINLDFPVVIGEGDVIKKLVYFGKMWTYFDGKLNNDIVDYIDLRYDKHIFLGFNREQIEGQS